MKSFRKIAVAVALLVVVMASAQEAPKREFRGAWLHIIGQGQYAKMTPQETQDYLRDQLNKLDSAGVNAVIWQVRLHQQPRALVAVAHRGGGQTSQSLVGPATVHD